MTEMGIDLPTQVNRVGPNADLNRLRSLGAVGSGRWMLTRTCGRHHLPGPFLHPAAWQGQGQPPRVRQDWSANGGALVWNALDPFLHVPDAKTSLDYPYVQSWIDALGPNAIIHEEFKPAKPGELLPTRAEHEAATRPVDRRYLPGHQPG